MEHILDICLLILGFLFTFLIPGYLIIQTFFYSMDKIQKLPLFSILSLLVSTCLVYFASLLFGYSKMTILLSFALFLPWIIFIKSRTNLNFFSHKIFLREHYLGILTSAFIAAIFFLALYPGVFTKNGDGYVMSSVNWQDTALHQSIIETISQGNFPPQAPYFSGVPLKYYYFIDFHSSILETLYGSFFPRIIVFDNPLFVLIFSLSIYSLSYYFTKNKWVSFLSILICIFSSNLMFVKFIEDLLSAVNSFDLVKIIEIIKELLANHTYTLEYGKLLQFTPTVDYLLQNRPMMIGLPAVAVIYLLCLTGLKEINYRKLILAGLIAGMLIKFQLFASLVGLLVFTVTIFSLISKRKILELSKEFFLFLAPYSLVVLFFVFSSQKYLDQVMTFNSNFSVGPWLKDKSFFWFIEFYLVNLPLPLILCIILFLGFLLKKIRYEKIFSSLVLLTLTLFLIPLIFIFTIYEGDMLKFYYFMMIPLSILSGYVLNKLWQFKFIGSILVVVFIFFGSFTSILTLTSSYLNKNQAYSEDAYLSGLWIRENTPKKSIFIEVPRVHSAVAEIGGRLRILSYINWPYTHGYNVGEDNVFSRLDDIESLYKNSIDYAITVKTMKKYNASYIYYSEDERNLSMYALKNFGNNRFLKLVYSYGNTNIFKLIL